MDSGARARTDGLPLSVEELDATEADIVRVAPGAVDDQLQQSTCRTQPIQRSSCHRLPA